jgi:hypothetical protein
MVQGSEPEDKKPPAKVNTPAGMFIRDIPEGAKLRLRGEAIVEVIVNAKDGGWLMGRYLESPEDPEMVGTEDWVFFGDVIEEVK